MGTPERVHRAKVTGNAEALSVMGIAGAKVTNEIKRRKKDADGVIRDRAAELRAADEAFRRAQAGEDILPPDNIE